MPDGEAPDDGLPQTMSREQKMFSRMPKPTPTSVMNATISKNDTSQVVFFSVWRNMKNLDPSSTSANITKQR